MRPSPRRGQLGQSLALFVLFVPGLFAFVALGLDAGNLYIERREMQAAADLAALAGARLLPDAIGAVARARSNASTNGYSSTVTVTTPYLADAMRVEVTITQPIRTLFLPILGVSQMDVSARSVARSTVTESDNPYAIFAAQNSCSGSPDDTLESTANAVSIVGLVHSNAGIGVSSSASAWAGGTEYKCLGGFVDTGLLNIYLPAPVRVPTEMSIPITYTWSDFCSTPTYYHATGTFDLSQNGPWWVGGTRLSRLLNPGVYCADGVNAEIRLSTAGVSAAGVTFVSRGSIDVSSVTLNLTPAMLDTAMAAFGSGPATITSSAGIGAGGVLYAPNGQISFTGPVSGIYLGSIVGKSVSISGGNFTLVGTIGQSTQQVLQLIE